jgi:hypothetical protein
MHIDVEAVARRFAALDGDDYESVAELLANDCQYVTAKGTLIGPAAIIESYRNASIWAKSHIECVRYESTLGKSDPDTIIITFISHLEHNGCTHTYSCQQMVKVNEDGLVCRITHQEIPGQREAADTFLQEVGVRRTCVRHSRAGSLDGATPGRAASARCTRSG